MPSQHGAFELIPENVIVASPFGNLNIEILPVNFYVTPEGPVPGDANCDGLVNVNDVIITIYYILGNIPKPFCFANADLNGELEVDVTDVVGIIHIILQME